MRVRAERQTRSIMLQSKKKAPASAGASDTRG